MSRDNQATLLPSPFHAFGRRATRETLFTERTTAAHKDFLKQYLFEPPPPKGSPEFGLDRIIGRIAVKTIQKEGVLCFHATGDTGHGTHTRQEDVANAMAADCPAGGNTTGPAFFLHLGDVTYGPNKDTVLYRSQFFEPYAGYPRNIIAIAGNHDGDTYPDSDPVPLGAFLKYFCDDAQHPVDYHDGVPHHTMNLPGVYWHLRCPFVDIIGLYSNRLENPGMIEGGRAGEGSPVSAVQAGFLTAALRKIRAARASGRRCGLMIAVHHPPFSAGGHIGSQDMLDDMDACCRTAGIMPDAVLSGHAHNYQRFTRKVNFGGNDLRIPYLVAGGGGRGITAIKAQTGTTSGDHRLEQYDQGFGYLIVSATAQTLGFDYYAVDGTNKTHFDSVTVDLATNRFV